MKTEDDITLPQNNSKSNIHTYTDIPHESREQPTVVIPDNTSVSILNNVLNNVQ